MSKSERVPIAERLAQLNQSNTVPRETTPTLTDSLATQAMPDLATQVNATRARALTVTAAGELNAVEHGASVDMPVITFEDAKILSPKDAEGKHLLVTGDDVDPRELEALAVSISEDAGWLSPGLLRLTEGATLSGPWRITKAERALLNTPARMEQAWIVDVPAVRSSAAPDFLMHTDPLARAFPDGMPAGREFEVLAGLIRIARRLAGAVNAAPSRINIEPDADSAVDIMVYAPRWVDEEDLTALLRPYLPDIVNGLEEAKLPSIDSAQRVQTREEIAKKINIPEDELVRIAEIAQKADRKAAAEGFVVRGYSLIASVGNTSRVHITVAPADFTPSVLRFEQWPQGSAIEYGIRWIMPEVYRDKLMRPGRALRFERNRVKDQIELIASLIARSTAGYMLDEDQFLISDPE